MSVVWWSRYWFPFSWSWVGIVWYRGRCGVGIIFFSLWPRFNFFFWSAYNDSRFSIFLYEYVCTIQFLSAPQGGQFSEHIDVMKSLKNVMNYELWMKFSNMIGTFLILWHYIIILIEIRNRKINRNIPKDIKIDNWLLKISCNQ